MLQVAIYIAFSKMLRSVCLFYEPYLKIYFLIKRLIIIPIEK